VMTFGLAISPVISKVFEYCLLDTFSVVFSTADNQFGFIKNVSCSHAIYAARNIIDKSVNDGRTVNVCAIDLPKAFDKVNHHALFIKLMKISVPNEMLEILENWFAGCYSCVKWINVWSNIFTVSFGVRQGSVLSPLLFAIYLDDLAASYSMWELVPP